MKLQNIRAMARKEWWHLLRDARSLALMFFMPTMLLFLYGYAINLDIMHAPIGILQESQDTAHPTTWPRTSRRAVPFTWCAALLTGMRCLRQFRPAMCGPRW
jgi:hypothetical protein